MHCSPSAAPTRLMELEEEGFYLYGTSMEKASIAVTRPYNGEPATVGNGVMAAIQVDSQEAVKALYDKALELGGQDEGAPGDRGDGFYAGLLPRPGRQQAECLRDWLKRVPQLVGRESTGAGMVKTRR